MSRRLTPALAASLLAASVHAQTRAGGEFRLSTTRVGRQQYASVAVGPRSEMMVVWEETVRDGSSYGVFGRRYDGAGRALGAEFRVNTTTTGAQRMPSVAADPRGGFIVAWSEDIQAIKAQRYDPSGAPVGGEFTIASGSTLTRYPVMGFDRTGGFVVSWQSFLSGSNQDILVRRYDASGVPLDGGVRANAAEAGIRFQPWVARSPSGAFVVSWTNHGQQNPHDADVVAQRFDAAGGRLGGEFRLSDASFSLGASLAMSADGGFAAAWIDESGFTMVRRFDPAGAAIGAEFRVSDATSGRELFPSVAADEAGNFVVAWMAESASGRDDALLARFDAAGHKRGPDVRAASTDSLGHLVGGHAASVAADPAGNFSAVWETVDLQPAVSGVYGQRFGGLVPAGAAVDTGGNGVLEAGETVDLHPSWRNVNGDEQSFTGTLKQLSGPAGATYTITDASASYGSVANGATGACTDCYGVSVSAPSVRPAMHWDAIAEEALAPDAQGQVKRWPLHIGGSFTDVPSTSAYYRFAETLLHRGVTIGCNADHYCPGLDVAREQMAVFVLVSKEGSAYLPPACGASLLYDDVPATSPYCRWVEELSRRGVVGGCGPRAFCPGGSVTREQMAVFLLRTLDPALSPPACAPPNTFPDVPETDGFCRWVEELARRGITTGCGAGNYCPAAPVARDQMAAFLTTTFGLTLY